MPKESASVKSLDMQMMAVGSVATICSGCHCGKLVVVDRMDSALSYDKASKDTHISIDVIYKY